MTMILLATVFLAQGSDWIDGAIILGLFVLSAIASLGKWIVRKIAESRELEAKRREGMPVDSPRTSATIRRDKDDSADFPPVAPPTPPVIQRTRKTTGQPPPQVLERMMEVLLEKATGTKLERRLREIMPKPPAPPPAVRPSEQRARKQSAQRPSQARKPARPMTIAEREAHRERTRKTEVELEAQRLAKREQQFTDDTDQRLGHVVTHIREADERNSTSTDVHSLATTLDDPDALRRAFVLSEIIAPPLALRNEAFV